MYKIILKEIEREKRDKFYKNNKGKKNDWLLIKNYREIKLEEFIKGNKY